jgi:hypothetical protein
MAACPNDARTAGGHALPRERRDLRPAGDLQRVERRVPERRAHGRGYALPRGAGICDVQETCDGTNVRVRWTRASRRARLCRAVAGICDVAETCNGGVACPNDGFVGAGTVCRASFGVCDVAETCTGGMAACPGDARRGAGTLCRASAGICDPQETCDGSSVACPNDARTPAGTLCRAVAGICDVQETCNGSAVGCPNDGFVGAGTVCRASANQPYCDPVEYCTGGMAACPGNTIIRSPGTEVCNAIDDNCDGVIDNGSATVCGSAISLGSINQGGGVVQSSFVSATAGAEQWYVVTFPTNYNYNLHGTGRPSVTLSGAAAHLRMEVRYGSCGAAPACSASTQWQFADTVSTPTTGFTTRSSAWPTTVYVRVYRISSPTTCGAYTITATRP